MFKKILGGVALLALGTAVWSGTSVGSYATTAFGEVTGYFSDQVSPEFELKRIEGMLEDLDPQILASRRAIAVEQVSLERLRQDVADARQRIDTDALAVRDLRGKLDEGYVTLGGRRYDSDKLTPVLHRRFESLKAAEKALAAKREALDAREESVVARDLEYRSLIERRNEYRSKLEALAAQYKMLQARKVAVKYDLDDTVLGEIDASIRGMEDKIAVERTLADEAAALDSLTDGLSADGPTTEEVAADIDAYFSGQTN